jgi:hypothetical protein
MRHQYCSQRTWIDTGAIEPLDNLFTGKARVYQDGGVTVANQERIPGTATR